VPVGDRPGLTTLSLDNRSLLIEDTEVQSKNQKKNKTKKRNNKIY
jgi:hypothetical protein